MGSSCPASAGNAIYGICVVEYVKYGKIRIAQIYILGQNIY
jgi:hypothetical protein